MGYAGKCPAQLCACQDKSTHAVVLFPLKFMLHLDKTACEHVGFNLQGPESETVSSLVIRPLEIGISLKSEYNLDPGHLH